MDNKFIRNTISVAFSNFIVLLSSIVSGFIIPRLLGVTEYGYYQIFALYLSYTALLHFGFVDGVLLKYAGIKYEKIDKTRFNTNTQFYILMQFCICAVMLCVGCCFFFERARIIFIFIMIDTLFVNITAYYQYVSQGTMRFKELSRRKIFQAILKVILVVILFVFWKLHLLSTITSYAYITGVCIIDSILAFWYIFTYREITFGNSYGIFNCFGEYGELFKKGIFLTLSYQVAHFVFVLDKQFVVKLFDTDTYSIYAFAYSLISMVTTIVSAVSLVLFPSMKQKKNEDNIKSFDDWISLLSIVVFAACAGFFVFKYILTWVVPKYESSLEYVRIIFPGLAISCTITIIIFNYYKVFNKTFLYMIYGLLVIIIGGVLNYVAYQLFGTPSAISIASIITLYLWFILTQSYFVRNYNTSPWKNIMYSLIISTIFWLSSRNNNFIGLGIYLVGYAIVTMLMYKRIILKYLKLIKRET